MQTGDRLLLCRICLLDFRHSVRDLPTSGKSGVDDDYQGDGDGESESSIEATIFEMYLALCCVVYTKMHTGLICSCCGGRTYLKEFNGWRGASQSNK